MIELTDKRKSARPNNRQRINLGQVVCSKTTTCPFAHRTDRFPKSIIATAKCFVAFAIDKTSGKGLPFI